ncbi:MAG TPA: N-acetyltransferase [Ruminococcaceae bacterium]|nr:N-acetyltransferase [Oscillospiraceae bacterium]
MTIQEEKGRLVALDEQGKQAGELLISEDGDTITIEHTRVDGEHKGQGIAGKLVLSSVEKARREGKKIVAVCPFAKKEFAKKPEYQDVLKK